MKVLVIERVGQMERVLAEYILQHFPEAEVKTIFHADTTDPKDILAAIATTDVICFQSIFDSTQTFEKMAAALFKVPAIRKPTYIIHTTGQLLNDINHLVSIEAHMCLTKMLDDGMKIHNIYYHEFENPLNQDGVFKKIYFSHPSIVKFDTVELWHNADSGVIWDARPYFISPWKYNHFKPTPELRKDLTEPLSRDEMNILKDEILKEMYAFTSENLLRLEEDNDGCHTDENDELIEEKKKWIAILKKLGVSCPQYD